jgi:hypothetical protein
MIAHIKSFLNPETQVQMYKRIAGVLIGCIAIVFVSLLMLKLHDVRNDIYIRDMDGKTVLKISADNTATIYQFGR